MARLRNILKPFFFKYDCDGNGNLDTHELAAVFVDLGKSSGTWLLISLSSTLVTSSVTSFLTLFRHSLLLPSSVTLFCYPLLPLSSVTFFCRPLLSPSSVISFDVCRPLYITHSYVLRNRPIFLSAFSWHYLYYYHC
jgi:hypothetical protein